MVGRKRHILVDTQGRLMGLFVHDADIQDPDGGRDVLSFGKAEHPRLEKVWADARYEGSFVDWAREKLGVAVEIVRRLQDQAGFVVLARRWVVDMTHSQCPLGPVCPRGHAAWLSSLSI